MATGSSGPGGGAGSWASTLAISGCSVMPSSPRSVPRGLLGGGLLAGEDVLELVLGPAVPRDALQLVGHRLAGRREGGRRGREGARLHQRVDEGAGVHDGRVRALTLVVEHGVGRVAHEDDGV